MTDAQLTSSGETPSHRRIPEDEDDIIRRLSAEAKLQIYEEVKELLDAKAARDAQRISPTTHARPAPDSQLPPVVKGRRPPDSGLKVAPKVPVGDSSSGMILISEDGSYDLKMGRSEPDSAMDPSPVAKHSNRRSDPQPRISEVSIEDSAEKPRARAPGASDDAKSPAKRFTLLTGLSREQVRLLRSSGSKQKFEQGEKIFSSGDAASGVYIILRGRVEVVVEVGGLEHASVRRSGEWFGELELMNSSAHRHATATAVRPTSLFEISGNPLELFRWLSDRKASMRLLRNALCLMGRHLREMAEESAREPSREKDELKDSSPTANWEEATALLPQGLLPRIEKCRSFSEGRLLDGQHLYREGETPGGFYFVQTGTLDVFRKSGKRQRKLSTLEGPMIIGDVSFFSHHERSVSVRAFGPVRYLKFSGERFERVKKRDTEETLDLLLLAGELAAGLQRVRQGVTRD